MQAPTDDPPIPPTATRQQIASSELVRAWVRTLGGPPLVMAIDDDGSARDLLESCARDRGYEVLGSQRGLATYRLVLEQRPIALISEQQLPDCSGRDLLAALRRDFLVREIPFIMIPAAEVAQQGEPGAAAVLEGLAAVLTPGCALHQRVQHQRGDVNGWVEPVGIGRLIRTLEAVGFSGVLRLDRVKPEGQATVSFRGGALAAISVTLGGLSTGVQGLVDLIGYEWRAYSIAQTSIAQTSDGTHSTALGDVAELLERARQHNNAFMQWVYERGTKAGGVRIDETALDHYLQTVPPACLEPLIRIVDGDAPKSLAEPETEAMLRSLLYEMRRQTVLRLEAIEAIEAIDGRIWSVFTAHPPKLNGVSTETERDSEVKQQRLGRARIKRRIWVAVSAFLLTSTLALGGFYGAHHVFGPDHPIGGIWSRLLHVVSPGPLNR